MTLATDCTESALLICLFSKVSLTSMHIYYSSFILSIYTIEISFCKLLSLDNNNVHCVWVQERQQVGMGSQKKKKNSKMKVKEVNIWVSDPLAYRVFCPVKHLVSLTVVSKNDQNNHIMKTIHKHYCFTYTAYSVQCRRGKH